MTPLKVIVGMSGGVDSSVTAYLLKERGYEVEGVSFILYEARLRRSPSYRHALCCSIEAIKEAALTASQLGISHTIVDLREEFIERVINPFIEAYAKGLTPNPCILCNKYIKFPHLMRIADERGAYFIATGHYARIRDSMLLKGIDEKKDQSYVLYVLGTDILKRLLLPLGDKKKSEVREIARTLGLAATRRPESQEICFIEEKRYGDFIANFIKPEEGPVIELKTGRILKTHRGIIYYTVGQRRGLGISSKEPLYVIKIDPNKKALYVGTKEEAYRRELIVDDLNIIQPSYIDKSLFRATVKIRSTMKDEPATIYAEGNTHRRYRIVFDRPQWAPAPGQSAVFYEAETVIGGGTIKEITG